MMWLQMFYEWCAKRVTPKPSLQAEILEEAALLQRDTVYRRLKFIEDEFAIKANVAKANYLLTQINSPPQ